LNLSERFNEVIALDFDLACTARLRIEDGERDEKMMEAMGMGTLTKTFGAGTQSDGGGPVVLDA
jgi:hypothetical protein